MAIIQQIAVKAVEEIFESVKASGLNDIGKTIKALTPVVSRTVLKLLTAFLEDMDRSLVTGAKALRREDGITVKERDVPRTWLTELGELTYKRTYFRLRDGSFVYLLDHIIGVESYERISKELVTYHNIHYLLKLMERVREAILNDSLGDFRDEYYRTISQEA